MTIDKNGGYRLSVADRNVRSIVALDELPEIVAYIVALLRYSEQRSANRAEFGRILGFELKADAAPARIG